MHLEDVHLLCTISLLLLSPVNTPRLRSMVISHLQARRIGTKIKPRHSLVTSAPRTTVLSPFNTHGCHRAEHTTTTQRFLRRGVRLILQALETPTPSLSLRQGAVDSANTC
ncbi:hypothetical protein MSAN_01789300 [Mycena sanguinolenta]|uniref:Secreted protein n=1 Tax=Mycena sanguinolenta TaxID=230812 RepID=A0A8H6XVK8_9AGAR|nr:hypothetical protein MSAN_01789300 [Mycena sanguinolenta]